MSVVNPALFHTGLINQDRRVVDMAPSIMFLAPRFAQILLFAAKPSAAPYGSAHGLSEPGAKSIQLGVRTVTNFEYKWLEDQLKSTVTAINNASGYTTTDTSFVVDDASIFAINDLVQNVRTGEVYAVTAVNTGTNVITALRSWGAIAAAAINDNDSLMIIGNSFSENSVYVLQPQRIDETKYNYIQDTRHAFGGTFVLQHSELYGGDQKGHMRSKFLAVHQQYIEASLIWGQRNAGSGTDGSPKKTTGGLLEGITTNVKAITGALTKSTWHRFLRDIFTYGSAEKVIFGSPAVMEQISNFAADSSAAPASQIWLAQNARSFGLNIMTYMTKFGTVHLVMHGMFTGDTYGGYAIAIDPGNIQLCRVRGGFFMNLREDIVRDGAHHWIDEYATYFGLALGLEKSHGVLTGVAA